jgi:2-iminobutanoate/2-iminopropanoate deaminase
LYCSGQIPLDAASGEVFTGDISEQTKRCMENVRVVLKEANFDFSDIVKTTIFLTDMSDFTAVNEVYSTYFKEQPPARSCVAVKTLPKNVNVEVEVIGFKA